MLDWPKARSSWVFTIFCVFPSLVIFLNFNISNKKNSKKLTFQKIYISSSMVIRKWIPIRKWIVPCWFEKSTMCPLLFLSFQWRTKLARISSFNPRTNIITMTSFDFIGAFQVDIDHSL
jgi:hypothetical protein